MEGEGGRGEEGGEEGEGEGDLDQDGRVVRLRGRGFWKPCFPFYLSC